MKIPVYFGVFSALVSLVQCEESLEMAVKMRYAKWKNKYRSTERTANVSFESYLTNVRKITLQQLKYYTDRSLYLTRVNGRSGDPEEVKALWNGFIEPKVNSTSISGRLKRPSLNSAVKDKRPTSSSKVDVNFPPAPSSLDYRELGLVSEIDDQGYYCACCYSFAAACALEGQQRKWKKNMQKITKQQTVDCSRSFGNFGCEGGYMAGVFEYFKQNQGVASDLRYPYVGVEESCRYDSKMTVGRVTGFEFLHGDEEHLKRALAAIGPIAVAMKGDLDSFYYYGGGIYDDPECKGGLSHAVCLIGYGTDNRTTPPTDYWILKNSWSDQWGEEGTFRLLRGKNLCGITGYMVYPTVI